MRWWKTCKVEPPLRTIRCAFPEGFHDPKKLGPHRWGWLLHRDVGCVSAVKKHPRGLGRMRPQKALHRLLDDRQTSLRQSAP